MQWKKCFPDDYVGGWSLELTRWLFAVHQLNIDEESAHSEGHRLNGEDEGSTEYLRPAINFGTCHFRP